MLGKALSQVSNETRGERRCLSSSFLIQMSNHSVVSFKSHTMDGVSTSALYLRCTCGTYLALLHPQICPSTLAPSGLDV